MAKEFIMQFASQPFTAGQQLAFNFDDKRLLGIVVRSLEAVDVNAIKSGQAAKPYTVKMGLCIGNTNVQFEKAENSSLNLVGKSKG